MKTKIKRYEGIWARYLPFEDGGKDPHLSGYEDESHRKAVCGCAWRLVRLYLEEGESRKALRMLEWLEQHDSATFLVNSKQRA